MGSYPASDPTRSPQRGLLAAARAELAQARDVDEVARLAAGAALRFVEPSDPSYACVLLVRDGGLECRAVEGWGAEGLAGARMPMSVLRGPVEPAGTELLPLRRAGAPVGALLVATGERESHDALSALRTLGHAIVEALDRVGAPEPAS